MEGGRILRNSQIIVLGVCIAAATIISSVILSQGFLRVMKFTREQINVTGSAQKEIKSDYIVWRGEFWRRGADLKVAYTALKADGEKVKEYMKSRGVLDSEIGFSSVATTTLYKKDSKGNDTNEIEGYSLGQTVEIKSADIDRIAGISNESTELIAQGVEFSSGSPEYFYMKLEELKIEMLAKATKNAKKRAENMAKATGNRIGLMRTARMGVFQITPVNSNDVSDYGMNDTTSIMKKVTAVVTVSFAIQ